MSAAFSPIIMIGALVLPDVISGVIDASATRNPATLCTYTTADLAAAAKQLHSGAYGALGWVESRPLSEGPRTFAELLDGKIAAPKVVLLP